ncbi:MAG TPA: SCO family protein [Steroidobacteraceae bacterium]|nr:SCO family protein [Steroidobacteraceae bacterium]
MALRGIRWLLVAAAVCAAFAGFWLARQLDRGSPQLASGSWLPQAKPVADFQLTDTDGRPFTRHELASSPALVFFGFTHCPDVCPTTLVTLAQVEKSAAISGLRVLFITVDPQRDTAPVLGTYVHAFDPKFRGLTGEPQAIARVAANFAVAMNRIELPGGDYTMDHSAVLFLVDDARIRAVFTPPFDVAAVSADLKRAAPWLGRDGTRSGT